MMLSYGSSAAECGDCNKSISDLTANTYLTTCTKEAVKLSKEHQLDKVSEIDTFADGEMLEYNEKEVGSESGVQSTYSAVTERVHTKNDEPTTEDDNALKIENVSNGDSSYIEESHTSLPDRPEAGDSVPTTWWMRIGEGDGESSDAYAQALWAWVVSGDGGGGPGRDSWGYLLGLNYNAGDPVMKLQEGVINGASLLAKTSVNATLNTWYQFELDWSSEDTLKVTMYDDYGTETISATDGSYETGSVGWSMGTNYGDPDSVVFFDQMVKHRRDS